jgi:hypothetical protein
MSAKNSLWFQRLLRELEMEATTHPDPIEQAKYQHLLMIAQKSEDELEQLIWEAKNIGVRNPAFPDDLVGWLDDDFDDDDDEDHDDHDEA